MPANTPTNSPANTPAPAPAVPGPAVSPRTARGVLALDAVVTGGNGLLYLAFSGPLGELLGARQALLSGLGLFLAGYALVLAALAARRRPPRPAVLTVAGLNLAWAVLSLVTLAVRTESTTAATVWIPLQAAVVVLFAVVQLAALPRRP